MEEETFSLTWDDPTGVHQEEVICGPHNEFQEVCEEVVVQENELATETIVPDVVSSTDNIVYLTEDNNLVVMETVQPGAFQQEFIECEVQEEVVADDWAQQGGEITVGEVGAEEQIAFDEVEIPLATDQDEYTASHPYPCDFCSRRFRKKANLMNHMVCHQTERPHGCNLCGARYIRKCDLMNHLKIHAYIPESSALDNELPPLIDDETEMSMRQKKKTSPPNSVSLKKRKAKMKDDGTDGARPSFEFVSEDNMRLLTEMENHANSDYLGEENRGEPRYPITDAKKPFVCQHCGVGFAREKALASHARIHAGDSPFECETCGEMFWDVGVLREHVRSKHGGIIDDDYDDEDDEFNVEDEEKYGEFFCQTCGMSFHRQDLLKRHSRLHIKEEFLSDEFGHTCNVCGESFAEALDLLAHAEVHARGLENRCNLCGEMCGDEQAVAAHVMQRHGKNLPPHTCMLCGKTCKDRRTLLKHSWEHSKEKTFSCSKCGKNFHNKARLKRHMMSHRNKIVTCDVCGEDFPDGRSLMNHRHSHSNISGRQFPCRECGKTFGSRSSQQIHIRIHTGERPYGCRFCWKAFADGGTLRKHERIHTGEKPYACAVCPRAFNQRVVLREHIRSHHSGPDPAYSHTTNPYCCAVCNDLFSSSQDLIIHLINHCDMNTAMKRQPQIGPRKYKRRRKLKPHELEYMSARKEDDEDEFSDSADERSRKRFIKKVKKPASPISPKKPIVDEGYENMFQSFSSAIQNINTIVNSKPSSSKMGKKKFKIADGQIITPRPKMIHTQKTRIAVEANNDGKLRHKTKTLVTRTMSNNDNNAAAATTPNNLSNNSKNDRIRPRTKNVNYHVLQPEKYPLATFDDDTEEAVQNLLATSTMMEQNGDVKIESNVPDVAVEETVACGSEQIAEDNENGMVEIPQPPPLIKAPTRLSTTRTRQPSKRLLAAQQSTGTTLEKPPNKIVRYVKGGVVVSKKRKVLAKGRNSNTVNNERDPLAIPSVEVTEAFSVPVVVKQEPADSSSLHELAELSMQHAKNQFKCEMCSEVFSDRTQLLLHVPIHI